MDAYVALIAIGPFVLAALAPVLHGWMRSYAGWLLAAGPLIIFLYLLTLLEPVVSQGALHAAIAWVPAYDLDLSFTIDGLSLTFALTISAVGTLIVLYSAAYLKGDPHQGRFFAYLLAFMGAMLGLVLADNLLGLFLFWELTSVTSFLLIGYDHTRQAARRAAIQAFVVTNLGGMGLLVGSILFRLWGGSWNISELAGIELEGGAYGLVLFCMLAAAFTKSAQVPFHFWLPNAMEAPTPVSAFLHSATMVQAGVYLLARFSPILGGTSAWTTTLAVFGSVTLLWGALSAFRQTDLKQMLAQSTLASLGLLVLLIGIGTEVAIMGAVLYFVAHALYKAGLFMAVGSIDHEAGTRDITALSGLADKMPVTFIGSALAALSMIGLPATLSFFAKEEMYLIAGGQWQAILTVAVLVLGNALLAGIGMLILVRPFLGELSPTPKSPHEAPIGMLAGPVLLGGVGVLLSLNIGWFSHEILGPMGSVMLGHPADPHLSWIIDFTKPAPWLSLLTWMLGYLAYREAARLRTWMRRLANALGWTADTVFDAVMFGLIRFAAAAIRVIYNGRLELYFVVAFAALALATLVPLVTGDTLWMALGAAGWPSLRSLQFHEWTAVLLAIAGIAGILLAQNRLATILAFGIQGAAVALIFLFFGAPDLAFTQFMVEVLSVVIITLAMTRLKLEERDARPFEDWVRDGAIALCCGVGVSLLLVVVLSGTLDMRLSEVFAQTSVPIAHGHNIVNVILVDYRGFDTLGEISVLMGAGIAIAALLRRRRRSKAVVEEKLV